MHFFYPLHVYTQEEPVPDLLEFITALTTPEELCSNHLQIRSTELHLLDMFQTVLLLLMLYATTTKRTTKHHFPEPAKFSVYYLLQWCNVVSCKVSCSQCRSSLWLTCCRIVLDVHTVCVPECCEQIAFRFSDCRCGIPVSHGKMAEMLCKGNFQGFSPPSSCFEGEQSCPRKVLSDNSSRCRVSLML